MHGWGLLSYDPSGTWPHYPLDCFCPSLGSGWLLVMGCVVGVWRVLVWPSSLVARGAFKLMGANRHSVPKSDCWPPQVQWHVNFLYFYFFYMFHLYFLLLWLTCCVFLVCVKKERLVKVLKYPDLSDTTCHLNLVITKVSKRGTDIGNWELTTIHHSKHVCC